MFCMFWSKSKHLWHKFTVTNFKINHKIPKHNDNCYNKFFVLLSICIYPHIQYYFCLFDCISIQQQNKFRCRWPLFGLHTVEITEIYSHLKKEPQKFRETNVFITKLQCKMFSRKFSQVRVNFG